MVIDEKGLLSAMKDAYKKKSTGYKVAARILEDGDEELIVSAPGWTAFIIRENAPRKVMGLIVEHVGDLPRASEAYQVQDKNVQAEIFKVAVPAPFSDAVQILESKNALSRLTITVLSQNGQMRILRCSLKVSGTAIATRKLEEKLASLKRLSAEKSTSCI